MINKIVKISKKEMVKIIINRTWFKCEDCECTWYDDCNNSFDYCPECGSTNWEIFEDEKLIIKEETGEKK